jgi:hypothetical protein
VLAEQGRARRLGELARQAQRRGGLADGAEVRVLVGDDTVARERLRVLERLGDVVDAADGDAGVDEQSSSRSGRPIAVHRSRQKRSLPAAIVMWPSAVANAWNGTIEGCALLARRGAMNPCVAAQVPTYMSSLRAVSNSETSASQPSPSRPARWMPASIAIAATYPPERSTSDSPLFVGGPAGSPVRLIQPAMAWMM